LNYRAPAAYSPNPYTTVRIEETTMTSFVLITTHRITPGATDDVVALLARYERRLRSDEPGLLTFQAHLAEDGDRLALLHVLAGPEAADRHLQLVAPLLAEASTLVRNLRIEAYGEPGPALREAIARNAAAGVATVVQPRPVAGFSRATR
jgi:hypothetical protein